MNIAGYCERQFRTSSVPTITKDNEEFIQVEISKTVERFLENNRK